MQLKFNYFEAILKRFLSVLGPHFRGCLLGCLLCTQTKLFASRGIRTPQPWWPVECYSCFSHSLVSNTKSLRAFDTLAPRTGAREAADFQGFCNTSHAILLFSLFQQVSDHPKNGPSKSFTHTGEGQKNTVFLTDPQKIYFSTIFVSFKKW